MDNFVSIGLDKCMIFRYKSVGRNVHHVHVACWFVFECVCLPFIDQMHWKNEHTLVAFIGLGNESQSKQSEIEIKMKTLAFEPIK